MCLKTIKDAKHSRGTGVLDAAGGIMLVAE